MSRFEKVYEPVNLNKVQYLIDSKRLNPAEPITMYHLWRAGAVGKIQDGVKLLGTVSTISDILSSLRILYGSKPILLGWGKGQKNKIGKTLSEYNSLMPIQILSLFFSWDLFQFLFYGGGEGRER